MPACTSSVLSTPVAQVGARRSMVVETCIRDSGGWGGAREGSTLGETSIVARLFPSVQRRAPHCSCPPCVTRTRSAWCHGSRWQRRLTWPHCLSLLQLPQTSPWGARQWTSARRRRRSWGKQTTPRPEAGLPSIPSRRISSPWCFSGQKGVAASSHLRLTSRRVLRTTKRQGSSPCALSLELCHDSGSEGRPTRWLNPAATPVALLRRAAGLVLPTACATELAIPPSRVSDRHPLQ